MRFGFWPSPWLPFDEMVELCTHAEATGWDGLWLADHFMSAGANTEMPFPEAWITLAALAARVPRVRVGTMVTGNTYRHPAVLAKMAATLDHISGGRVVLGLGSGWQENEHRQYGIEFDTIPGRLRRLDEACQVIKALYTEKTSNFSGRYYQLTDATLEPKPVQNPLAALDRRRRREGHAQDHGQVCRRVEPLGQRGNDGVQGRHPGRALRGCRARPG